MVVAAAGLHSMTELAAIERPDTLADRAPVTDGAVELGFPIQYVGVVWEGDHHHNEPGIGAHGFIRFRHDGVWGPWIRLIEDGVDKAGIWASGLVAGDGAEAYQIRGLPEDARSPRAVALNTTDGPPRVTGYRPVGAASAIDNCLARPEWGADESLRFDDNGNEIWPPDSYEPQVMTVHHTATQNDDPDPAATVRAIYEYHTVDQGWGDIGYHMLIDEQGRVYEGRWSGTESTLCSQGGDGRDFAHNSTADDAKLVTAGHTGGYNSGNLGVALLGEFTTHPRFGGEPKQAAVDALVGVLAEHASRHNHDPHAVVTYVNPVTGDSKEINMISGHRDWKSTECPGERLYDDLPEIRDAVAASMTGIWVSITNPSDGETVSGQVTVSADASDSATQVDFSIDGTVVLSDTEGNDGWSFHWDSASVTDGDHTIGASATDGTDGASDTVTVTVANTASSSEGTIQVSDLDGSTSGQGRTWTAHVMVTVVDDRGGLVTDAIVSGTWTAETGSGSSSCTTDSTGTCTLDWSGIHKHDHSATYTVEGISHASLAYDATANTDPDGDSDGTTIVVNR